MKSFKIIAVPFFLVLIDLAWAQLNLPDMPGPPYPDRWGNNRWGVKYDPRIHGRGRSQQSAPSSSGNWFGGGRDREPEELPPTRFRGAAAAAPPAPPAPPSYPTRSKWIPGLKPLVSSLMKYRRRPRRPGPLSNYDSDNIFRNPYSRRAVDGYVKNYMNHYNSVSQTYPSSSDFVNIQNYMRPSSTMQGRNEFRPNAYARIGNSRPSFISVMRSDESVDDTSRTDISGKGSLKNRYTNLFPSGTDLPSYSTITDPQTVLFKASPQISKKTSVSKNFAETLSTIYKDDFAGADSTASSKSSSSSRSAGIGSGSRKISSDSAVASSDDYLSSTFYDDDMVEPHSYPSTRIPPSSLSPSFRPKGPGRRGPNYVERPFVSGGIGGTRRKGPQPFSLTSRGPPPFLGGHSSASGSYSSGSLSSHDFPDDEEYSSSSPSGGPFSSDSPFNTIEYSDSPPVPYSSSSGGSSSSSFSGPSSTGPMTVSTYSMSGPPPSSFPSSFDSIEHGPGPFSSSSSPFAGSFGAPPSVSPHSSGGSPFPYSPGASSAPLYSMGLTPGYLNSPYMSPALVITSSSPPHIENYPYSSRPKPIKRKKKRFQHTPMNIIRGLLGRNEYRERRDQYEDGLQKGKKEGESYKPAYAMNIPLSVPAPVPPSQYSYNVVANSLTAGDYLGARPPPMHVGPYPPPPHGGPIASGLSSLRDTLVGGRDRPPYYRLPPPPPPPPPQGPHHGDGNNKDPNSPANWPKIFTAMGSSVDAVAGGIHAVRKELSKATGQALAKGIVMGGSTMHEVSKGMAHMITKMSSL